MARRSRLALLIRVSENCPGGSQSRRQFLTALPRLRGDDAGSPQEASCPEANADAGGREAMSWCLRPSVAPRQVSDRLFDLACIAGVGETPCLLTRVRPFPKKSPLPHTAGVFFVADRHAGSTFLALRLLSTGVNSGRGTGDLDHCQTWPASNDQPLFTVSRDALHPISPEGAAPGTYRCSRVALTDRGQTPDLPQVRLAMLGDYQPRG